MERICGIDEAGRGPLAGPVTAAAVVLPSDFPVSYLADSKQISENKRNIASRMIISRAEAFHIGWAWPGEIDRMNIHHASLLAMARAFAGITATVDLVLVDGKFCPNLRTKCTAVIKGDTRIPQIMAASILAKVARDRWMIRFGWIEPAYEFEKHKGYPTKRHRQLCISLGPSGIQRKSFSVSDKNLT